MDEGLLTLEKEKADIARIVTIEEIRHEEVRATGAIRTLELTEQEARHGCRQRNELIRAMEVATRALSCPNLPWRQSVEPRDLRQMLCT